ncbi:MAG TPA: hypothetical protein PKY05_14360, partial [Fibrobacteria bacterium]|nr:hypothetical protein [Fibrobacteria bacterium]
MKGLESLRGARNPILSDHAIGALVFREVLKHLGLTLGLRNRTRKRLSGTEVLIRPTDQIVIEQMLRASLVVRTKGGRIVVERIVVNSIWRQRHIRSVDCPSNRRPFQIVGLPLVARKIEPWDIV